MQRLVVGITGASGAAYGVRVLERARELDVETHLVATPAAVMPWAPLVVRPVEAPRRVQTPPVPFSSTPTVRSARPSLVKSVRSTAVPKRSPVSAVPGTPAEQVKTLRDAFMATMKDKEFLAEAEKAEMGITPLSGTEVQELVTKLYASPQEIVERARKAMKPAS